MSIMFNQSTLALGIPGGWEWIVVLAVALLIFGKRLPEVGKSLGRGIVEFKKGLKGVEDEMGDVDREIDESVGRQKSPPKTIAAKSPHAESDVVTERGPEAVSEKPKAEA
jgi:sec-independent protein translocase protein TatA